MKNNTMAEMISAFNEQKKELIANVSSLFRARIKDLMKENPLITELYWDQYTPYFNDGDSCVFGVHNVYYRFDQEKLKAIAKQYGTKENAKEWKEFISKSDEDESIHEAHSSYDTRYSGCVDLIKSTPELCDVYAVIEEFEKEFASIPNEVFLDMFGDHCSITVSADEIKVEEFEHD